MTDTRREVENKLIHRVSSVATRIRTAWTAIMSVVLSVVSRAAIPWNVFFRRESLFFTFARLVKMEK